MNKLKPSAPVYELDEVDRQWAADGAKVLARIAQGDCHLDDEGWWVETSTGKLIGIDPQTDRPILSDQEAEEAERRIIGRGDEVVLIRLDLDVLERLKAEGPEWQQTRINAILRKAMGMD